MVLLDAFKAEGVSCASPPLVAQSLTLRPRHMRDLSKDTGYLLLQITEVTLIRAEVLIVFRYANFYPYQASSIL